MNLLITALLPTRFLTKWILVFLTTIFVVPASAQSPPKIDPYVALQFIVGTTLGQMRMALVEINGHRHMLLIYSEMESIDPGNGSFIFPTSTVKLALYDFGGNKKWGKELPNVVPGTWFLPVLAFDLEDDGVDEIYLVNNLDGQRPFRHNGYVMQRLDSKTGEVTGEWPWARSPHNQASSYKWRFFIMGGYVNNTPVLLTQQGTYRNISIQAWNPGMKLRWKKEFPDIYMGPLDREKIEAHYSAANYDGLDYDGPRGSHTTPVIDTNNDGIDEVLIGERCIDLDRGEELFIMDHKKWDNHSDVVQPVWNNKDKRWYFWTCREKGDDGRRPRAVFFNDKGDPLWAIKEKKGHFHRGWAANLGPNGKKLAMAARYAVNKENSVVFGGKSFEYWVFDAFSGEEVSVPFNPLGRPFDFNGDGIHEILVGGEIIDHTGENFGSIGDGGSVITLYKIDPDLQGEQILAWYPDGTVRLWADRNAKDSRKMQQAFNAQYYQQNIKLTGSGYNGRCILLNY